MQLVCLTFTSTKCCDSLQKFEDYVRGSTGQLKMVKNIYRFHILVFSISQRKQHPTMFQQRNSKLQAVAARLYCTRRKPLLSLLSLIRRDNDKRGMHVLWLSHGWLKSVDKQLHFGLLLYTSCQVEHLYACLPDRASSSIETYHQHYMHVTCLLVR